MCLVPMALSQPQTASVRSTLGAGRVNRWFPGLGGRGKRGALGYARVSGGWRWGRLHRPICGLNALSNVLEMIREANWMYMLT